jgi:general secretion pathway protein G
MKRAATAEIRLNNRGMTLIEIMVVLLIVGALAATLGKTVWDNLMNANVKQTKLMQQEFANALRMYNTECGSYPTTEQGLDALAKNPGAEACANWGPRPFHQGPFKDAWQRPFSYESDGATFTIKSNGPDKRNGGGDDLVFNSEGSAGEAPKN